MKGKFSRGLSILLVMLLVMSLMVGCGKNTVTPSASATPDASATPNASATTGGQTASETPKTAKVEYPLKTNVTLRYYTSLNQNVAAYASSYSEVEFWQEVQKRTGVKLEFVHNTSNDNFNMMLAAGDLPDLLKYNFSNYPGGPDKAIADGVLLKLNDYMEEWAPNLTKYYKEHPEIARMARTDTGAYYVFPFIRGDEKLQVYRGPIIREDWLNDLGLSIPETIDEWYNVLTEFKVKKGATAPLTIRNADVKNDGVFSGAYGVKRGMYIENGKVVYGEMQPEFKNFLITWNKWMSEGLVDSETFSINNTKMGEKVMSGISGASHWSAGSAVAKWNQEMADKDPKFHVVAAPYPTLKKGETPKFGQYDLPYVVDQSTGIYAKSPNIEIAMKFMDYAYGEEGHMLYNFGIEGVSYNMVNGYPKYTDLIMNNPNGLSVTEAMSHYFMAWSNGSFVQDVRYNDQYQSTKEQQDALNRWTKTDMAKHVLPTLYLLPEEADKAADIKDEVDNYCTNMFKKFVLGQEPIENFDEFRAHLKNLGIEKLLQYYQNAYDRYLKR